MEDISSFSSVVAEDKSASSNSWVENCVYSCSANNRIKLPILFSDFIFGHGFDVQALVLVCSREYLPERFVSEKSAELLLTLFILGFRGFSEGFK